MKPLSKMIRPSSQERGTMCEFHNFGLIFAEQCTGLPQRLKSTLFEIFTNGGCPKSCNHMGIFFDIFK